MAVGFVRVGKKNQTIIFRSLKMKSRIFNTLLPLAGITLIKAPVNEIITQLEVSK
jgi:hypothetical protein